MLSLPAFGLQVLLSSFYGHPDRAGKPDSSDITINPMHICHGYASMLRKRNSWEGCSSCKRRSRGRTPRGWFDGAAGLGTGCACETTSISSDGVIGGRQFGHGSGCQGFH
ncbi:hypothetical protein DFH29DRAFT_930546 [Suillus ampliporus]|nr:hypothetical protein DFH29DRAFT_930546 [Suillus ampliporus]